MPTLTKPLSRFNPFRRGTDSSRANGGRVAATAAPTGNIEDSDDLVTSDDLIDPEKPRIDVSPADLIDKPAPPSVSDKALWEFVVADCYKRARDARIDFERDWILSLEFSECNQWVGFDRKTRNFVQFADRDPDPMRFSTTNQIGWRLEALASLVTQSAPESTPVAASPAPIDQQASVEARGILAHYNRKFGETKQVRKMVDWSLCSTTSFLKQTFDPTMLAEVPRLNGTQVVGTDRARIGDIDEQVIPGFRVYLDPAALEFEDCRWLIHAELYPLSWYQMRFANGNAVVQDKGGGWVSYRNNNQYGIASSFGLRAYNVTGSNAPIVNKNVATCYEMWILPDTVPLFPHGALIQCAGDQVLRPKEATLRAAWRRIGIGFDDDEKPIKGKPIPGNYLPWPYDRTDVLPFYPLPYKPNPNSPYGRSIVEDVVEPQMDYNRTNTRIRERLEKDKLLVAVPKLSGIGADKLVDYGTWSQYEYNPATTGGGNVSFLQAPPIPPDYWRRLDAIKQDMDDIMGMHDPNSRGAVPAGVTSGIAIENLQKGDSSRLSRFSSYIEAFVEARDTGRIALASQFFAADRLISMSDITGTRTQPKPPQAQLAPPPQGAQMPPAGAMPPQGAPGAGQPPMPQTGSVGPSSAPPPPQGPQDEVAAATSNVFANVMSFKALTGGGSCRIVVKPGSALAETPDARNQRVMEYAKLGVLGPTGSPEQMMLVAELTEDDDQDIILQRAAELRQRLAEEAAASQPPPPPNPIEIAQAQSDIDTNAKIALQNADTQAQIAIIKAKAMYPAASIAFKGDPPGAMAVEEQMGLPIHDLAMHTAAVGHLAPNVHSQYGGAPLPANAPAVPDPNQQAQQQASLAQQTTEHAAGVDVAKQQALSSLQPPAPAPPDPDAELARQKDLASHQSALKIAEIEAAEKARPKPATGGSK